MRTDNAICYTRPFQGKKASFFFCSVFVFKTLIWLQKERENKTGNLMEQKTKYVTEERSDRDVQLNAEYMLHRKYKETKQGNTTGC